MRGADPLAPLVTRDRKAEFVGFAVCVASLHAGGGANVLAADGTVHFLSEDRAAQEVRALATKDGEEPVRLP